MLPHWFLGNWEKEEGEEERILFQKKTVPMKLHRNKKDCSTFFADVIVLKNEKKKLKKKTNRRGQNLALLPSVCLMWNFMIIRFFWFLKKCKFNAVASSPIRCWRKKVEDTPSSPFINPILLGEKRWWIFFYIWAQTRIIRRKRSRVTQFCLKITFQRCVSML